MKKTGILHPEIIKLIAETGHTEEIVITDAGLPIPEVVNTRIDLALKEGLPSFLGVLKEVINEFSVEKIILAEEIKSVSPDLHNKILDLFKNIEVEYLEHVNFKSRTEKSRGLIRSGEFTPFANIILVGGVVY